MLYPHKLQLLEWKSVLLKWPKIRIFSLYNTKYSRACYTGGMICGTEKTCPPADCASGMPKEREWQCSIKTLFIIKI